jgi:predicted permease
MGFRQNQVRALFVIGEMALATILLIGSGLLIRTFAAMHSKAPGFDPHNILTLRASLSGQFKRPADVNQLVRSSIESLHSLPGVEAASAGCCLPIGSVPMGPFVIPGRPMTGAFLAYVAEPPVSPEYFDVFRIPMLRGRKFTAQDAAASPHVAIISEAMARRYWPNGDALGAQIRLGAQGSPTQGPPMQIVGIAGEVHERTEHIGEEGMTVYIPSEQAGNLLLFMIRQPFLWMVRTKVDPNSYGVAIKNELQKAIGGLPVIGIRSMDDVMAKSTARQDFKAVLMLIFGGSALLLAAIGIYGLMMYSVQQRTQEIGIRMALGAGSHNVRNMVISHGMRLSLTGGVIGIVASLGLTRLIASFLYGVHPRDPGVFIIVPILLTMVALFAVWLPARRATRIDPVDALRSE